MASRTTIDGLADAVMKEMNDYAETTAEDVKSAVRKAGSSVKKEISANAPKKTGAYSKSWSVKTTKETSNSLEVTVYSPTKYRLAHLLEYGHAKRGGGRTSARPHIAPAEQNAIDQLEREIKRALG